MSTEIRPLPVAVVPSDDESGVGYLMRVAQHNGMSLRAMLEWLHIGSVQAMSVSSVHLLAYTCGVSVAWLAERVKAQRRRDGLRYVEWLGLDWPSSMTLRRCRGQVCGECLKAGSGCRLAWEATGVCACPFHRCYLIDSCGYCGRAIDWSRPALDVCRCGRYLGAQAESAAADQSVLRWVEMVAGRMLGVRASVVRQGDTFPAWLAGLSPDGMYAVVHAAGVRAFPYESTAASAHRGAPTPRKVAELVQRGLERLLAAGDLDTPCTRDLRGLFNDEALARLSVRGGTDADRSVARELAAWVRDVPRKGLSLTGRHARVQLELFR
jgi:hypothetical protein